MAVLSSEGASAGIGDGWGRDPISVAAFAGHQPWFACAVLPGIGLRLACSSLAESGWFWTHDVAESGTRLIFGTDPGEVVRARRAPVELNHSYLRSYLFAIPPDETPYQGVHRLPSAITATFATAGSEPVLTPWPTPRSPASTRSDLLAALDEQLWTRSAKGPVAILVSGGLDSTFLLGSLLAGNPHAEVLALTAAPLPDARISSRPGWDADESGLVSDLADMYPGRVRVRVLRNEAHTLPLDAAAARWQETWLPSFGVTNEWWIGAGAVTARDEGYKWLLSGGMGNAVFSLDHRLALYELVRGGHIGRATELLLHPPQNLSRTQAVRSLAAGPARQRLRHRSRPRTNPWADQGVAELPTARGPLMTSSWFREAVTSGQAGGHSAAHHPAGSPGCLYIDPFRAGPVLDAARRLRPEEWLAGPWPRGLARTLGAGRVPDTIRLRTRRGMQSPDTWYVMHQQRDRYLDEARAVARTPGMCDWVDVPTLVSHVESANWGDPADPGTLSVGMVNRLLALAGFIRDSQSRLQRLAGLG